MQWLMGVVCIWQAWSVGADCVSVCVYTCCDGGVVCGWGHWDVFGDPIKVYVKVLQYGICERCVGWWLISVN